MKSKLVMSIGMLTFVGVAVVGATGAFFSDTETSTGNTFTAGAIDLKIDSQQHYNRMVCVQNPQGGYYWQPEPDFSPEQGHYPAPGSVCTGSWALTDLENGVHTFFNFNDIKPGDEGENTISLHVISNPAWACIDVDLTKNDDVSSTEPELDEVGEVLENAGNVFDGELAQNITFAAWLDQGNVSGWQGTTTDPAEGDNKWQGEEVEPLLFSNQSGPASDVLGGKTYTLADSTTTFGPISGGQTNYIGLAWCAGTQVVNTVANTITCNGAGMGNIAQTDMMEANITFRVEQSRNNDAFRCARPAEPAEEE